jgi:hypothetical protein
MIRLRVGKLRNFISIPGFGKRIFSSSKHQERFLLPYSLQYLEYRVFFVQEKSGCSIENDYSPPPIFDIKKNLNYISTLPTFFYFEHSDNFINK